MTEVRDGAEIKRIGGLIVAAGRSSRMGAHKMLLPLGNGTVLRQGVLTMLGAGISPLVVVVGRDAALVRENLRDLPVETVENAAFATTQMMDSVKLGLKILDGRCDKVLFAPGDAPMYSTDTIWKLVRANEKVCVPANGEKTGHPVCFDAGLLKDLLQYDGPNGLSGALDRMGGKSRIECADEGAFLDADTPEDYERLKEYYQRTRETAANESRNGERS